MPPLPDGRGALRGASRRNEKSPNRLSGESPGYFTLDSLHGATVKVLQRCCRMARWAGLLTPLHPLRLPALDDDREQWHQQGHVLRVTAAGPRPTCTGFPFTRAPSRTRRPIEHSIVALRYSGVASTVKQKPRTYGGAGFARESRAARPTVAVPCRLGSRWRNGHNAY